MTARRLQNWANRNLFIGSLSSFERDPDVPDVHLPRQKSQKNRTTNYGSNMPVQSTTEEEEEEATIDLTSMRTKKRDAMEADRSKQEQIPAAGDEAEGVGQGKPITALQAAWNVTNAIQGMFIVGLPFAVKVGGWASIFALVAVAYICYRTGIGLISCLYDNEGTKIRKSYREIAEAVSPGLGKWVLAAQLTELASTCILYIVLAGDLLQGCIPSVDMRCWMMLATVLLIGTAFLDNIRIVSNISLANAVSHLVINAIIVLYCLSQFSSWSVSSVPVIPHFRLLPTVIGVVVFGYTSHIFLPSLEGAMKDPKQFNPMLAHSHTAAALFKSIFGLIGFLTFAEFTQKEISNSLPNQGFKVLVNLILVVKALLSYPLPYFAIVQLLKENFFRGVDRTWFPSCYSGEGFIREWALCLRILLILWTLFMALTVPYLVELMGLIGNITGNLLSFIWPAYFHLALKGNTLDEKARKFDKIIIGIGVGTCIIGVYYSSIELISAVSESRNM